MAMRGLWEDIQEATLNVADYYLSRSVELPHLADDYSRNAARLYSRYLAFQKYALTESSAGVPDSAYFAAHEAARGVGDSFLLYASAPDARRGGPRHPPLPLGAADFPFDRTLWSALTAALEKQGRESDYIGAGAARRRGRHALARGRTAGSAAGEPEAERLAALQRAFSDSLAVMYLGFAESSGVAELQKGLSSLQRGARQHGAKVDR